MCPLCSVPEKRMVEDADHAFAMLDASPVLPGHTLIVVRRHIGNVFELRKEELAAIIQLIHSAWVRIEREHEPMGYNIGVK